MCKKSEVCLGELDHFHDRAASGHETSQRARRWEKLFTRQCHSVSHHSVALQTFCHAGGPEGLGS